MILGTSNNAPILEFDEDDTTTTKTQFFGQGKKEFWRFIDAQKKGIRECLLFFPRAFCELESIMADCKLVYEFKSASTISPIYIYKDQILIANTPLGGPAAANLVEELAHVGVKTFVAMGSCGCLDTRLDPKTLIVPTSAIRDEGVSYHYLPASRDVSTSKKLNQRIGEVLSERKLDYVFAKIWTTDAIYRETASRIARRKAEGAIAVEMECASIAAVCKNKGLDFAEILYVSDVVSNDNWQLRRYDKLKLRTKLVDICFDVLQTFHKGANQ